MYVDEMIEFTNSRGDVVKFDGTPFGLVSLEGLGDVGADIQTQKAPFQDGSTYLDAVMENRYMPVEFIVRGTNYDEVRANRAMLSARLNPKMGLGTLTYKSGDTVRIIEVVAESVPYFADSDNRGKRWQRGLVTFVAPNPYWQSPRVIGKPAFERAFRFPFKNRKFAFGIQRDRRIIVNEGDAPTDIKVEFFGPAENPKIINRTTGEYIRVNQTLNEGERMVIDTSEEVKSVYFIDENDNERDVFNWLDLGSTFFQLQIGKNDIDYTADSDIQGAKLNIEFKEKFVGV